MTSDVVQMHTFGWPSRSSLWKTWQNFQQSTALLERGSRLTAAQKVWAPFSWWVPKMQGDRNSQGTMTHSAGVNEQQLGILYCFIIFKVHREFIKKLLSSNQIR